MNIGNELLALLREAHKRGASDLLIVAGAPPSVYVNTQLLPLRADAMTASEVRALLEDPMNDMMRQRLHEQKDLDIAIGDVSFGRCRVNVHYQRNSLAAAFRFIPDDVPDFDALNLPNILRDCARLPRGLVLITGGTGSGKSTTLAAMINQINHESAVHVITLEDPIEYTFTNQRSIIEQREIGVDTPGFGDALRHVVRQKPDVILIGEMRDLETIRTAITAAETGHLVLASLHTINAAQTVERIVDVFDPVQQAQIRVQLAGTLQAIACQTLFHSAGDGGMVPAVEILISTPAIARAIRDGDTHLIDGMIETGATHGMQSLDRAIIELVNAQRITRADALAKAIDPDRMEKTLDREAVESVMTPGRWE